MNNSNEESSPVRSRTLEFRQAMKDFHIMFPSLERNVIECVLRSNSGHVDSTIDQLLQLTQDGVSNNNGNLQSLERLYYTYDESSDSSGSISPELRDRLSSSDEDPPPKYTPTPDFAPPPFTHNFSTQPVDPFASQVRSAYRENNGKHFRDWNPPLLGTLPHDFLRIVPCHNSSKQRQPSSRRSLTISNTVKTSPCFDPPNRRPLQRRKTTGGIAEVSSRTFPNDRSSQQSSLRATPRRSINEQSQYVEDRKFALLLQNEEFLKELRRNEEFLQELKNEDVSRETHQSTNSNPREFHRISVSPLEPMPPPTIASSPHNKDNTEDKDFQESLNHMNKSAKKSFYEIARRFYSRRKSYKSMNNTIDPAFVLCEEDSRP